MEFWPTIIKTGQSVTRMSDLADPAQGIFIIGVKLQWVGGAIADPAAVLAADRSKRWNSQAHANLKLT